MRTAGRGGSVRSAAPTCTEVARLALLMAPSRGTSTGVGATIAALLDDCTGGRMAEWTITRIQWTVVDADDEDEALDAALEVKADDWDTSKIECEIMR